MSSSSSSTSSLSTNPVDQTQFILALDPLSDMLRRLPSSSDTFVEFKTEFELWQLKKFLLSLPDGTTLPCRGRDYVGMTHFTDFDFGCAVKNEEELHFIYETGAVEHFRIDFIDYRNLVHFVDRRNVFEDFESELSSADVDKAKRRAVLIAHGWSPDSGPSYSLIRTLELRARAKGWFVVVPDFREAYRFGHHRGRSERTRMLLEELLVLRDKGFQSVVLVGHSQGGAAVATVTRDRVVKAARVVGLMMIAAESPVALDGMDWTPNIKNMLIVHPEKDSVIHEGELRTVAGHWKVPFRLLTSKAAQREVAHDGSDLHHDFLTFDLSASVVNEFETFLSLCARSAKDD